jgi:metallo-beta-lactamase class B
MLSTLLLATAATLPTPAAPDHAHDAAIDCASCPAWNAPQEPFRLHGNSWYVGPRGLSSVLLAGSEGLILFDGALPQSAAQIEANIVALGHRIEDLRWILVSHAHFDHVGGIAELQRRSGARVGASPLAAAALRSGNVPADDPQAAFGAAMMAYPALAEVVGIADGETIRVGELAVTALHTPGHTPGGSSWQWQSCVDGHCVQALYADSLNAVSHGSFRFSDAPARVAAFRASIARVAALDCSLLVAAHPGFSGLFELHEAAGPTPATDAFVSPGACRRYAEAAGQRLDQRLASEQPATPPDN